MTMSAELDIGPLTWVKGEIDLALERTLEALERYGAEDADSTHLKAARTHLHQAHGALSIVGFDGVTRFSEVLEQVIGAVDEGKLDYGEAVSDMARYAIVAIRNYLEDLSAGQPDQPLRLLPMYRQLSALTGQSDPVPSDLFFPDLSLRPPPRQQELAALDPTEFVARVKAARLVYERGLLKWLKRDARGVQEMRSALTVVEMTQVQPAARSFWWSALAFMDTLAANATPDVGARRLCARIDTQIKRLSEGSRNIAERLMRNTLYYVAVSGAMSDQIQAVRSAFRLDKLIPQQVDADIEPLRRILHACREDLTPAVEAWNRFCAGTAAALPQFHDLIKELVTQADNLQHQDISRLTRLVLGVVDDLRRTPLAHNEALALEMATALLLLDEALIHYQRLGDEFAEQVTTVSNRLDAALHGKPLTALETPLLDEVSRQAQEKLLLSQVVKEIQINLGTIEQVLDAFFRDQSRTDELATLIKPIQQTQGVLTVLGQERAVEVLRECETAVEGFMAAPQDHGQADFEAVASNFSALGFFVEDLQHGSADIDRYLRPTAAVPDTEALGPTAEIELEHARHLTNTLVGALHSQPEDTALRGEIRQHLEVVRDNAELVEDAALAEQASAAIVALESDQPTTDLAAAVAQIAPVSAPVTQPSPEAARLAEASAEEIDAELLGIFIEESHEVLAAIEAHLPRLADHPHDRETLTTVRRSFHTLKGSGRMVGLTELGEAAWAVEQVLNRWLQLEQEASPALLAMLRDAHQLFNDWVCQLESGSGPYLDASALAATCEALKTGAEDVSVPPVAAAESDLTPVESLPEQALDAEPVSEEVVTIEPAAEIEPFPDIEPPSEAFVSEPEPPEAFDQEPVTIEMSVVEPEPGASAQEPESPEAFDQEFAAAETPVTEPEPEAPALEPEPPAAAVTETPQPQPVLTLVSSAPPVSDDIQIGDLALSPTLYNLYLREANGYITTLQHELSAGDKPRPALIRAAHTLAGISATTGIMSVRGLAHALEVALNRLSDAGAAPTEDQHLLLARAIGALEGMVGAVAARRLPENEDALATALNDLSSQPAASPGRAAAKAEKEAPASEPPAFKERRRSPRQPDQLDQELLPIFTEEGADLMRDIATGLRAWHKQPDSIEAANQIKRILHTLKGSARMAGAMNLGELVHGMETRIEQAISANALTSAFLDMLDASFDRAFLLMDSLHQSGGVSAKAQPVATLSAGPASTEPAPVKAQSVAPISARASRPSPVEPSSTDAGARNLLRVRADIVDKLVNEAGEIAIARGRIEGEVRLIKGSLLDLTENVIRLRNQLRDIEIQAELQMQSRQALSAEEDAHFDPLEFDRFTRFQELTRMMAESVNDIATSQHSLLQNLNQADAALVAQARLSREHSQALMGVRTVPFSTMSDRFYRVIRQASKELGKRANLEIMGGQTELDRSVLEKMTGPIEHLLRNAIAHGIEAPEQRQAAGKPEMGEIVLRIGQEGNEIVVELTDDGRGFDYERIKAQGIAAGLIPADQPISQEKLADLIFQTGFSTAEAVSSIAGRGVGLDVVRNVVTNLGGRVHIDSTHGRNSRFLIHLPLTLAITQAVLVRIGSRHFAIPSSMIAQVRELKNETIATVRQEGTTTWLGDLYPWRYLPHLLGHPAAQPEPARYHWLLLLRTGDQRIAVEVDDLIGNQELVVKNIGEQLARVAGIAGATVLGDGEIVLILNPLALADRMSAAPPAVASDQTPPGDLVQAAATERTGVVMVVDDSLTVRKITGRLLAREGYNVVTAKDGVDALEQLIDLVPDVMLVDIEMPRMDGFDLTRNIRADERLKNVPIVMITSRIGDKHRNYAMEIGVNHYMGKPYDEDALLKIIAGYTGKATST